MKEEMINKAYEIAKERYAELGVDTEKVLNQMQDFISACIAGRQMTLSVSRTLQVRSAAVSLQPVTIPDAHAT